METSAAGCEVYSCEFECRALISHHIKFIVASKFADEQQRPRESLMPQLVSLSSSVMLQRKGYDAGQDRYPAGLASWHSQKCAPQFTSGQRHGQQEPPANVKYVSNIDLNNTTFVHRNKYAFDSTALFCFI